MREGEYLPLTTPSSKVFHTMDCRHVRRSARMQTIIATDGLRHCKHCAAKEKS